MNYLRLLFFCLIISLLPQRAQAQTPWQIIKGGIMIFEGIQAATEIFDWLTREDNKSAMVFSTDSPANVSIYLNGNFVGTINRNHGITCKVGAGAGSYRAVHANGNTYQDQFHMTEGVHHNIFVSSHQSDLTYVSGNNNGYISGNTVNFRSNPVIGNNKLAKLGKGDPVKILDVMLLPANPSDLITLRRTRFTPENGHPFDILTGIAVTFLESANNGYAKVRFTMNDRSVRVGYIQERDLGQLSNKWIKVNYRGTVGWVYGDYVRQR